MSRAFALLRISVAIAFLVPSPGTSATLFDPGLRFRSFRTQHFVIYFHGGEERLAARLGVVAEEIWRRFRQSPGLAPPDRTHVVLVDQSDGSNGWAYPIPRNTIVVTAAWPAGSELIGRGKDWLRVVFAHEFAHIVHLDRSRGWARLVRGLFGRVPLAFPNLFLPTWQIEGLATYEESAMTGGGRLHAGDFRAIEREAARHGAIEPLDRINGGLADWPDGLAPYAYGLGFHAHLAERYGEDKIARLADATARSVPYTGSRTFAGIFGKPLGALWKDYQSVLAAAEQSPDHDGPPTRLTHHGFTVLGPRFAPPACAGCPAEIAYSVRSPDGFPALRSVALDGSRSRRLAKRYLGSTTGQWREHLVFDQQEFRRNVGTYSDLFALNRATGQVRPITREARLLDPDVSPDGRTIVCVREGKGDRELVLVRLASAGVAQAFRPAVSEIVTLISEPDTQFNAPRWPERVAQAFRPAVSEIVTLISEPDTQFNAPRWSPDGRRIAVERHRLGRESEIVLVDVDTHAMRVVATAESARIITPTWRPDGRAIVAAADFDGDTFNLYEFPLDADATPRQLTRTSGGATWPDISPTGEAIVFVGYTIQGFDLFTMPYPPASDSPARSGSLDRSQSSELKVGPATHITPPQVTTSEAPRSYSPWPTLGPTAWTPVVENSRDQSRLGLATGGADVLGHHAYGLSTTWIVNGPERADGPGAAAPDWQVAYAYDRWRPTLFASISRTTEFFSLGEPSIDGPGLVGTVRERQLEGGVIYPIRHARVSHSAFASLIRSIDVYGSSDGVASLNRTAARLGWVTRSAHTYGYSISPEDGVAVGATLELVRRRLGAIDDATTVAADARLYLQMASPHHVLAIRGAGGFSNGDAGVGRTFVLGGAGPNSDVLDFGGDAMSLLRGFATDTFAGSRVAVFNTDYRWPIARPQRGVGTWPLFLHTIHAALIADAAHAWTGTFRVRDVKTSAGAEVSLNLVAGYTVPLTLTFGAAWGHDGAGPIDAGRSLFVRVGHAF